MPMKMSAQSTGAFLLLLATISWGIVLVEAALMHTVSLLSVGSAVLVTSMVFAWPFLNGARVRGAHVVQMEACRFCATPPVPGLKFCIRCGAYPKAT